VAFIYGLIQRSYFSTRWGARLITIYWIFVNSDNFFQWESYSDEMLIDLLTWAILGGIGILYSFNLTQLIGFTSFEKRPDSYDKANVRSSLLVELMNGERPAAARLLLYLLLFFFFWMSFSMLASIAS